MQSDQYEEVLGDLLVYHHGVAEFGSPGGAWLQEDLAACHASKRSKAVKADLNLNFLPWMRQIPDLCPIDNAWGELCRRLRERAVAPTNKEDLKQALCEEREAMPADLFTALAESIPRRVEAVIEAKGCGIKCWSVWGGGGGGGGERGGGGGGSHRGGGEKQTGRRAQVVAAARSIAG